MTAFSSGWQKTFKIKRMSIRIIYPKYKLIIAAHSSLKGCSGNQLELNRIPEDEKSKDMPPCDPLNEVFLEKN
jgi:hypothetical protein